MRRQRVLGVIAWLLAACTFDSGGEPTGGVAEHDDADGTATAAVDTTDAGDGESGPGRTSASAGGASHGNTGVVTDADGSAGDGAGDSSGASQGDGGDSSASSGGDDSSMAICGNGIVEPGETCETADFDGFTCDELGEGYGGTPSCAGCQIDDGPCCVGAGTPCAPWNHDCCNGCYFVCG
ncbi:MAG: hypothetical protein IPH07_04940 [Deltaproteobacteria bacterium]|nr:hypothetical protein [Deltaproteobacteria bacterium]